MRLLEAERREGSPIVVLVCEAAGPCPSMPVQTTAAEPNVHRSEHTCRSATTLRALGGTHVLA